MVSAQSLISGTSTQTIDDEQSEASDTSSSRTMLLQSTWRTNKQLAQDKELDTMAMEIEAAHQILIQNGVSIARPVTRKNIVLSLQNYFIKVQGRGTANAGLLQTPLALDLLQCLLG